MAEISFAARTCAFGGNVSISSRCEQSVENGGTGREKPMGPAGFRHGNRASDRQLAAPRVAPDRSPEAHHGQLQTPAAAPDRHADGKGGACKIDLPRHAG